jgi:hypothetical protein
MGLRGFLDYAFFRHATTSSLFAKGSGDTKPLTALCAYFVYLQLVRNIPQRLYNEEKNGQSQSPGAEQVKSSPTSFGYGSARKHARWPLGKLWMLAIQ